MSITDWRFWENSILPGSPLSWSRLMTSSRRTELLHHDQLIIYNWIMISTSNHIHLSSITPGGSKWFVYECSSNRYLQSLINIPKFSDWLEDLKGATRAWKVNKFDQHCSHSAPNPRSKSSGAWYLSFSTLVSNANRARVDKLAQRVIFIVLSAHHYCEKGERGWDIDPERRSQQYLRWLSRVVRDSPDVFLLLVLINFVEIAKVCGPSH